METPVVELVSVLIIIHKAAEVELMMKCGEARSTNRSHPGTFTELRVRGRVSVGSSM